MLRSSKAGLFVCSIKRCIDYGQIINLEADHALDHKYLTYTIKTLHLLTTHAC